MSFIGYLFYTSFLLACGLPFDFFNNVLQNEKFFQFWLSLTYRYFHSYHIAICFQFVQLSFVFFFLCSAFCWNNWIFCVITFYLNIGLLSILFLLLFLLLYDSHFTFLTCYSWRDYIWDTENAKKKKSLFRDFLLLLKVDPSEGEVAIILLSEGASQPGDWSLAMGWETV